MTHLKLYYMPGCPFCEKVIRFINDNNLDNIELKDITSSTAAKKELIENGGKEQVPCLFIDGSPMYESDDIIDWLKENEAN